MRARGADEIETERRGQEDEILHATRWKFKVSFDHQMEPRWSKGKGRGEGGDPVQECEILRVTGRIPAAVKFSSHRSRCTRTDTDRNSSREREKDARMLQAELRKVLLRGQISRIGHWPEIWTGGWWGWSAMNGLAHGGSVYHPWRNGFFRPES